MRRLACALLALTVSACAASTPADDHASATADQDPLIAGVKVGATLITTADVNFRKGASSSTAILDVLATGTSVTAASAGATNGFYRVSYGGQTGYVYGKYLKLGPSGGGSAGSAGSSGSAGGGGGNGSGATLDGLRSIASSSSCAKVSWTGRGQAPKGYVEGVALMYAHAVCESGRSDVAVVGEANTGDDKHDALSWYNSNFAALGMQNDAAGLSTVRHAYTLLLGLGMRESSGQHCVGRDTSASNVSADSAEAGAWQTSYDSHVLNAELTKLFDKYQAGAACHLDVFKQGVNCSSADWKNWGSGDGLTFQTLEKQCPAFAAEYAAVMLRVSGGSGGHYGPLRTKAAEIRSECDGMLQQIEVAVGQSPAVCGALNSAPLPPVAPTRHRSAGGRVVLGSNRLERPAHGERAVTRSHERRADRDAAPRLRPRDENVRRSPEREDGHRERDIGKTIISLDRVDVGLRTTGLASRVVERALLGLPVEAKERERTEGDDADACEYERERGDGPRRRCLDGVDLRGRGTGLRRGREHDVDSAVLLAEAHHQTLLDRRCRRRLEAQGVNTRIEGDGHSIEARHERAPVDRDADVDDVVAVGVFCAEHDRRHRAVDFFEPARALFLEHERARRVGAANELRARGRHFPSVAERLALSVGLGTGDLGRRVGVRGERRE